tara:strand:- start:7819 stop:9102 length:1284 start_codon:yes stop_codon:yes gene_type:complete
MNFSIDKTHYLVSFLFIITIIDMSLNQSGFNLRVLLYFAVALIIFKDILNSNILWFFKKTKFSLFKQIGYLYFLLHPILIALISILGIWGYRSDISSITYLLSGANMVFQALIGIFFIVSVNTKNFKKITSFIFIISWIFLIEFILTYIFSLNYAYGPHGEYISFTGSDWLVSLIALLAFCFSMSSFSVSKRKVDLLNGMSFFFLGYVAGLRITILAMFVFIFLSIITRIKRKLFRWFLWLFTGIACVLIFSSISIESLDLESIFDRMFLFSKQIDLISNYYVFGVGGNISERYYLYTSPYLLDEFATYIGLSDISTYQASISMNQSISDMNFYSKRSSHSTPLDMIGDYGLLGFLLVIISIYAPIKILFDTKKKYINLEHALATKNAAISVIALFIFFSLLSFNQFIWVFILLFSYMLHLYQNPKF